MLMSDVRRYSRSPVVSRSQSCLEVVRAGCSELVVCWTVGAEMESGGRSGRVMAGQGDVRQELLMERPRALRSRAALLPRHAGASQYNREMLRYHSQEQM